MLRVTNHVAGPMVRLPCAIKALAHGEPTPPIHIRTNDTWNDLVDDFNELATRIQTSDRDENVVNGDMMNEEVAALRIFKKTAK